MIDNYLLEYLVAFAQTGTIAGAAEQLNLTQPTISRGLKKLEALLDVQLFDRQPQKITPTATGKFTVQRAQLILKQQRDFKRAVQQFASKNDYLRIAATIPGPLLLLDNLIPQLSTNQLVIEHDLVQPTAIERLLVDHHYSLIISSQEIQTDQLESRFIGAECLAIKITKFNALYPRQNVNLPDLNGHEFVLSNNIGEWRPLIEKYILHAQFLYQSQAALRELVRYSNFPIFKTNITDYLDQQSGNTDHKRKLIPISDPHATLELYATYLKSNRRPVTPLVTRLTKTLGQLPRY